MRCNLRALCARCVRAVCACCRYVGYASSSYGDEYIGPSASNDAANEVGSGVAVSADDPASYTHVRERLDKWADVCSGAAHKVLMGGESEYGSSLGFGTRNGFVEHCESIRARAVHPGGFGTFALALLSTF